METTCSSETLLCNWKTSWHSSAEKDYSLAHRAVETSSPTSEACTGKDTTEFNPEYGGSIVLQNFGIQPADHNANSHCCENIR
jgi:hypothetical protein